MPVVSAESNEMSNRYGSSGFATEGGYASSEKTGSPNQSEIDEHARDVRDADVVVGIFAIIYLGAAVCVAVLSDHKGGYDLAWFNNNDYVAITDSVVKAALNAIIDASGFLHPKTYQDAYRSGSAWGNCDYGYSERKPCEPGNPLSSWDYVASNGKLLRRYFYDASGNQEITWDYDHSHGGQQPHAHRWEFPNGECKTKTMKRYYVKFNNDGTETLELLT